MTAYGEVRGALAEIDSMARAAFDQVWTPDGLVLVEVIPEIVDDYGSMTAAVAADWYDDLRRDVGVRPGYLATAAPVRDPGAAELIGWASSTASSPDTFQSLVWGGLSKRIQNAARETLIDNTLRDPQAQGWMRVGRGECGFCAMIIGRGAVYRSKGTANFAAHDSCRCSVAPGWSPAQIEQVRSEFVPSARRNGLQASDAEKARVNAWIQANL